MIIIEKNSYMSRVIIKDKGVHTFPKGFCQKVNVTERPEYELTYYDSAVHCFDHYTARTPRSLCENNLLMIIDFKCLERVYYNK